MRSAARDRQRSRSVRPPRRADGAAGWPEPGATRRRSWLARAAEQYTAGAAGMAVSGALRAGRGGSEPSAQRSVGGWAAARPSTGSGRWWGVAPWIVVEGSTFFSFFSFFSFNPFRFCACVAVALTQATEIALATKRGNDTDRYNPPSHRSCGQDHSTGLSRAFLIGHLAI